LSLPFEFLCETQNINDIIRNRIMYKAANGNRTRFSRFSKNADFKPKSLQSLVNTGNSGI